MHQLHLAPRYETENHILISFLARTGRLTNFLPFPFQKAPYEMGAASSSRYTGDYSEDSDEEDEVVRKGWIEPKRASTRATNSTANGTTAISAASTAKNGSGGKNTPTQTSSKSAGVSLSGTPVNPGWAAYGVTPASTYASSVTASEKASGKFAKVKVRHRL